MMTWLSVNQIPTLTAAKWYIASRPATWCRLKLADVTVYTYAGAAMSVSKNEGPVERKKYVWKNMQKLQDAGHSHRSPSNQTHFQGRNARVNGLFWRWPQQNIQESRSKFRKYWQKQTSGLYSTLQIRNTVEDGTFQLIEMDHISGSHRDSLSLHAYHNQRTCDAPLQWLQMYTLYTRYAIK